MTKRKNELNKNEGENVKIVVLDSGVCSLHPQLVQCTIDGYNAIEKSANIEDDLGHGTAVVGIIAKHAPKADMFIVKVFENDSIIDFDQFCSALEYINNYISFDILNISVGVTECPDHVRLEKVCKSLAQKGIIVSAFDNLGAISYPAAYPYVIGVDSESAYTNSIDYDFVESEIINIRGKGGNQRLLWNGPDYVIQSGSSFACAHITGIIANIIQGKRINRENVLLCLRQNAIKILSSKAYEKNKCPFIINRAICFPYNKEMDTLFRNEKMLPFEIVGIYDSKYNFNIGKTVQSGKVIENIEKVNWSGEFDTVILGHLSELSSATQVDYYEYIRNYCLKYDKNIFQFDPVKNERCIYSPNVSKEYIPPLNYGKLFMVGKPIVAIMGTSSCQGKFSLQLLLRRELITRGYVVGQLGTEPQSLLFGFDESVPCGYGTDINLDEQEAIGYFNYLLHEIEMKNPDIILIGGQSGVLPYAMYNIRNNSPYQKELLLASNPDAIILCINQDDDIDYIQRSITYMEALTECKVIALVISPIVRTFSWSVVPSKLKRVEDEEMDKYMRTLTDKLGINVFLQSQIEELTEKIIAYLTD